MLLYIYSIYASFVSCLWLFTYTYGSLVQITFLIRDNNGAPQVSRILLITIQTKEWGHITKFEQE
ncbi:hypothetical protein MtrunA17_Chr3g0124581 [Medicago truncatula]|uniref:Transmembrane protein n=1 Tax=Medicago truncatula TaxID=3880 RepID=A0A396IYA4_MEDTR|nr:hypothetical protein MtrunA17_Chr3g0124581 [Medicago truncatula]